MGRRKRSGCWQREIQTDEGETITYRAHAVDDPEIVGLLDMLAKAAIAYMRQEQERKAQERESEKAWEE